MIKKIRNFKFVIRNCQRGMTYVELIVVLSIFSVMTSIMLFNYRQFQENVDIKVLANDIAIKIVEAQKSATTGKLPSLAQQVSAIPNWKPSYGVYFDVSTPTKFIYFSDLDNSNTCNSSGCIAPNYSINGEVTDVINVTKGNYIPTSGLEVVGIGCPATVSNLSIVFKRPDSSALISSNPVLSSCSISYVQIDISSPNSVVSNMKIYPSGRIQIN